MSRDFNAQVPILVEAGAKVHPLVFLGGYAAIAPGGTSATFGDAEGCGASGRSCSALGFQIGAEVQVHLRPEGRIDPWVGYGLGYETDTATASHGGGHFSENFNGFQLARFAAGADVRVSRTFGVGPFLGLDFGSYAHEHQEANNTTVDQSIPSTALHEWLTLGVRGVLFP
jgi:hypothetical protein